MQVSWAGERDVLFGLLAPGADAVAVLSLLPGEWVPPTLVNGAFSSSSSLWKILSASLWVLFRDPLCTVVVSACWWEEARFNRSRVGVI